MYKTVSFGKGKERKEDSKYFTDTKTIRLPTDSTRNRIPMNLIRTAIQRSHRR